MSSSFDVLYVTNEANLKSAERDGVKNKLYLHNCLQ